MKRMREKMNQTAARMETPLESMPRKRKAMRMVKTRDSTKLIQTRARVILPPVARSQPEITLS